MKIALCISGYFTNKNRDNLMNSNYIYDNIINGLNNNNNHALDIFIHSFDNIIYYYRCLFYLIFLTFLYKCI